MSETRHASIVERRVIWQRTVRNQRNAVIAARRVMLQKDCWEKHPDRKPKAKGKAQPSKPFDKNKKPTGRGNWQGQRWKESKGRGKGNKFRGVDGEEAEEDDQIMMTMRKRTRVMITQSLKLIPVVVDR